MEAALKPGESDLPPCLTAAHEKRWLELIGDLKDQWQDLFDSPYSMDDFYDECLPEWCHTGAQYKACWKMQKKFDRAYILLECKWKKFLTEYGRIPQIHIPNMCAC